MLACIQGPRGSWPLELDAQELAELARSAGAQVCGTVMQRQPRYEPATLFGSGKVDEIALEVAARGATAVLCSRNLSPRQQLNLEDRLRCNVVDRTRLILDIFASRARSREGRLQVELAQYLYMLPRLAGLRGEVSRAGGGIGTRGPGETQLETDRRHVRARLAGLRERIAALGATRETQRRGRRRARMPLVALVGYTNAGKSTLHDALTDSGAQARDALFATLDPTTRVMALPGGRRALLTDTVGFVHDLPHDLVAAFRSTLEEVTQADLLLQVTDASHPRRWEQAQAVEVVLASLGAADLPRIVVWNKCDLPVQDAAGDEGSGAPSWETLPSAGVWPEARVSARTGDGLPGLAAQIAGSIRQERVEVTVELPFTAEGLVSAVRREGEVLSLEYTGDGIHLQAACPPALAVRLRDVARTASHTGNAR